MLWAINRINQKIICPYLANFSSIFLQNYSISQELLKLKITEEQKNNVHFQQLGSAMGGPVIPDTIIHHKKSVLSKYVFDILETSQIILGFLQQLDKVNKRGFIFLYTSQCMIMNRWQFSLQLIGHHKALPIINRYFFVNKFINISNKFQFTRIWSQYTF